MYLTRAAILETLRSIVDAAARGSELVFDYLEPGAFSPDAPPRIRLLLQRVREIGEPMLSGLEPQTLHGREGSRRRLGDGAQDLVLLRTELDHMLPVHHRAPGTRWKKRPPNGGESGGR